MVLKKLIKTTSLALLLTATTIFSSMQPVFAAEASYESKNLKTGNESTIMLSEKASRTRTSTTEDMESKISLDSVIGDTDDRTVVTDTTQSPYSAICRLQIVYADNYTGTGTGCLITSGTLLTAAHCLYRPDHGGYAKSITIYPGQNGSTIPYGSTTAKTLNIPSQYKSNPTTSYDYGVIKLNSRLYGGGHLNCDINSDMYIRGNYKALVAGYPDDDESYAKRMYKSQGDITSYNDRILKYDADTTGGESGAPILIKTKNNKYLVVGIHHGGYDEDNNIGVRITSDCDDLINSVLDQN